MYSQRTSFSSDASLDSVLACAVGVHDRLRGLRKVAAVEDDFCARFTFHLQKRRSGGKRSRADQEGIFDVDEPRDRCGVWIALMLRLVIAASST